jgi:Do/DeqQ family serine protease
MTTRNWLFLIVTIVVVGVITIVALGMIQVINPVSPFRRVALKVSPAVVNIAADKLVRVSGTPNDLDDFLQRYPQPRSSVRHRHVLGTGFIFDPRGYVLTNYHVISGYDEIVVRLADGSEYDGDSVKVVGVDPWSDLAVLKVETRRRLPVVRLGNSDRLEIGDWVAAVGNPFGLQGTMTAGIVSAFNRSGIPMAGGPQFQDFIQTDASINPGNSGGPLVGENGEVIGVNSGIRSPIQGSVGIGFAIPINFAAQVAQLLIRDGKVVRGYLGLDTQPIDDKIREALNLPDQSGALVNSVVPGGPADRAAIRPGDVILGFDKQPVADVQQFQVMAAGAEPGKTFDVDLYRWGKKLNGRITAAPRIETATTIPVPAKPDHWLGLEVRGISDSVRARSRIAGVVVVVVEPGSPAESALIRPGDLLLEINSSPITDLKGYQTLSSYMARSRRPLLFRVVRRGTTFYAPIDPNL